VNPDSGPPGNLASDDSDVDRAGLGSAGQELVEIRGAEVANDRTTTAGHKRRELARAIGHHAVADEVDSTVDRV
jgi:hypothetical protein